MKHRHCPRSVCVLSELEYDAATKPRNIRVERASPLGDASVRACAVQIPGRVGDDSGHCDQWAKFCRGNVTLGPGFIRVGSQLEHKTLAFRAAIEVSRFIKDQRSLGSGEIPRYVVNHGLSPGFISIRR